MTRDNERFRGRQNARGENDWRERAWRGDEAWHNGPSLGRQEPGGYFDADESENDSVFGRERDYGPAPRGYGPSARESDRGIYGAPRGRTDVYDAQRGRGRDYSSEYEAGYPGSEYGAARGSNYGSRYPGSGDYRPNSYPGGYASSTGSRGAGYGAGGYTSSDWREPQPGPHPGQWGAGTEWRSGRGFGSNDGAPWSRQERVSHRGLGPQGYSRADDRIKEEVSEALTDHDEVDARSIDVSVSSGEVTLSGSVPERHMKRFAELAAEQVRGVKDVHNQLRVKTEGSEQRSQPEHGTQRGGLHPANAAPGSTSQSGSTISGSTSSVGSSPNANGQR